MWFGVLGPLQVAHGDGDVAVNSGMQRRLLAALILHAGRVVSTDWLIAALWGDHPPSTALQSLRTYVYRLRELLGDGEELIVTRPPGYVLDVRETQIDARRFERLVANARRQEDPPARVERLDEALGLWRGNAIAEFADEEFARGEALQLEELRRVAVEERVAARLALGGHAEVVGELEAFVERHPMRERARGQLMLALYRSGRQAEALAVYRDFRALLDDELGLEVPESLTTLQRDILRQAPRLDPAQPTPDEVEPSGGATVGVGPATLPDEPTRLIGRGQEVAQVCPALGESRLLTVTGVGGIGKTRVALRVAHEVAGDHPDGVWWCELAPVAKEAEVAHAVATTLGVRPAEGDSITASVVDFLRARQALVVLDNTEHVLGAVASLVREIIRSCPQTRVLATGRALLGVSAERIYRLEPLEVTPSDPASPDEGPAVELFVERATAVRPGLDVNADERELIVEICARLDGLPLAIELAASRLRSMNPTDLAERLGGRLDLIADTRQDTGRHQTLRAVLDWSYRLLGRIEQQLFARLSVFAGSFTLEAAEQVAAGEGIAADEVADLLTRLDDHSLVITLPTGGPARYRLLETLRAYGREKLPDASDQETTQRRHADYYLGLAEAADDQVRNRDEATGVARLNREIDNLRAAHRWTIEHVETDLALRLIAALFRYTLWRLRTEVFSWSEAAASLPGAATHPLLPTVAGMAGWGAGLRGDLQAANDWAQRGLDVLDDPDDPRALVPLEVRMHTAMWQGRIQDCLLDAEHAATLTDDPYELVPRYVPGLALTYAGRPEEALTLIGDVQQSADRHGNPTMRALVRYTRAEALLETDPPRARPVLEEAGELADAVDNRVVLGVADVSLVSLLARHGETQQALRTFIPVIDRLQQAGDWTHLWTGLRSLVGLLAQGGDHQSAGILLGAVRNADNAPPVYGEDAQRLAAVEHELEQHLGHDALVATQARGQAMTDHEATALARTAIGHYQDG